MPHSLSESLKRALAASQGGDLGSQLLRGSMRAAIAGDPVLESVFDDSMLRSAAELDLHLAGGGVKDHRTRADFLGKFLTRAANAVKELAKDIAGLSRYTPGLLTEAPTFGSV